MKKMKKKNKQTNKQTRRAKTASSRDLPKRGETAAAAALKKETGADGGYYREV